MLPAVIVLQLDDGVEVPVGVEVGVAVNVLVDVKVLDGTRVGVLLGNGVMVNTWPTYVAVGVNEATVAVAVAVGVLEGTTVPGVVGTPAVGVFEAEASRSSKPTIVLALDEEMVREPIGMRFS